MPDNPVVSVSGSSHDSFMRVSISVPWEDQVVEIRFPLAAHLLSPEARSSSIQQAWDRVVQALLQVKTSSLK